MSFSHETVSFIFCYPSLSMYDLWKPTGSRNQRVRKYVIAIFMISCLFPYFSFLALAALMIMTLVRLQHMYMTIKGALCIHCSIKN
jgi:hypothetical protein